MTKKDLDYIFWISFLIMVFSFLLFLGAMKLDWLSVMFLIYFVGIIIPSISMGVALIQKLGMRDDE